MMNYVEQDILHISDLLFIGDGLLVVKMLSAVLAMPPFLPCAAQHRHR